MRVPQLATVVAVLVLASGSALSEPDHYPWITALSLGPDEAVEAPSQDVAYRRFRVVVLTSEIYNTVFIEELTWGEEGCCARIASSQDLDLRALAESLNLVGELAGFQVVKWLSPRHFQFTMHSRLFEVSKLGTPSFSVREVKPAV